VFYDQKHEGKRFEFLPKEKGTLAMKKYVDGEHVDITTMYFRQFSQKHKLSS